MKIATTSLLIMVFATFSLAVEPHEELMRLSAACQNATFKQASGVTDRSQFTEFIRASDKAMAQLVDSGFLVEEHLLMRAPSRMNGSERVHFEHQRMKLVDELAPRFGHYTVSEMMGWEFRDQIQGGRFFRSARDESKDYRLRVRLPAAALKRFEGLLSDYILKKIPKNKIGEQDGAEQPATAPESKPEGEKKPNLESKGRSQ